MSDTKFTVDKAAHEAFAASAEFKAGMVRAEGAAPLAPRVTVRQHDAALLAEHALAREERVQRLLATIDECPAHGPWKAYERLAGGSVGRLPQCPACAASDRIERALGRSGIPPRFKALTLDAYRAEIPGEASAKNEAVNYARDFAALGMAGHCLILHGTFGTGNTHLACGIGLEIIQQGFTVAHFTVLDVVRRWRESWAPALPGQAARMSEADVLRGFVAVDLLILEEIGRSKDSESERGHLFEILDGRYGHNKPTLITSNYPLTGGRKSIEGFLGQAAYDRLWRNGCTPVAFNWSSFTQRAKT